MNIQKNLLCTFLFFCLCGTVFVSAEAFTIEKYHVDMIVSEHNSYDITEQLDVHFISPRHGIFRTLPRYFDSMPIKISNVIVEGFESSIEKTHDTFEIRIGSADSYVEGDVRYTIRYTYDVGKDSLPDMDEFNHNVIGNLWDTTIAAADFRITLPKAFDAEKVHCTSGAYGSTNDSDVEWNVTGNTITGKITRPLENYEGVTVALPLPEGYWVGAVKHRESGWLFFTIFGYPLYALVIILAFVFWYFKGRDTVLFPSVEFNAPEGMTPSEIGYVIDGVVDSKDVTALILYWADKGFLAIEEVADSSSSKGTLELIKLGELGSDARSYERHVFKKLFSEGTDGRVSTADLTNTFYTTIQWAQDAITKTFTQNKKKAVFVKGSTLNTFLAGILAALPVIMLLFELFFKTGEKGFAFVFAIPLSMFFLIPSLLFATMLTGQKKGGIGVVLFPLLFGGVAVAFFTLFSSDLANLSLVKLIFALLSCQIASIFVVIMSKRTAYGDIILEKVLGFKEFIKTAEKEKLDLMFESNPQYFYTILPYAMVLGLSSKWASHFDGLALEPPQWYRGYAYSTFRARDFERNLNKNFGTLNSAMNSSPSSSGSSGSSGSSSSGGFSGGGSGGGGGGSW